MQDAACANCGQRCLVGPLHGERGGPIVCIPCGSKVHAEIRRGERRDKLMNRLRNASIFEAHEDGASEDELCTELLEDALRLTHPDRHPPERAELAHRVTQGLLALRPYVLPRCKPRDVSVAVPPSNRQTFVTPEPLRTALATLAQYPCSSCRHTVPTYYCAVCLGQYEQRRAAKRKEFEAHRARANAKARERRRWRRESRRKKCRTCGKSFCPRRSDSLHCSRACRQRAYRDRVTTAQLADVNKLGMRHAIRGGP
jgi:hypothetical protein